MLVVVFSGGSESYVLDTRSPDGTKGFGLGLMGFASGQAYVGVWDTGPNGRGTVKSSELPIVPSKAYHIVWQKNLSNTSLDIFVNGVKTTTCTMGPNFSTTQDWSQLSIGKQHDYNTWFYSGLISQLRINNGITYAHNFTPQAELKQTSNTVFLLGDAKNDVVSGSTLSGTVGMGTGYTPFTMP